MTLKEAIQLLFDEGFDDRLVYHVCDVEGKGWDGPRVTAVVDAIRVLQEELDVGS